MNPQLVLDAINAVMKSPTASALCLSKGGWEGWLQCEIWNRLNGEGISTEREKAYPAPYQTSKCDLVCANVLGDLWVEIKAYGIFREDNVNAYLDDVALDVMKLPRKPAGTTGLLVVVVPNLIADSFKRGIDNRRWLGFKVASSAYASLFYMTF